MIAYVDGSAVLERVLDRPGAAVARDVWGEADEVVASHAVQAEVRGELAVLRRTGALDAAGGHAATARLEDLLRDVRLVAVDDDVAVAAGGLADRHALATLDAVHLATALAVDAPRVVVATWRPELAGAAADAGMPVVPAARG